MATRNTENKTNIFVGIINGQGGPYRCKFSRWNKISPTCSMFREFKRI